MYERQVFDSRSKYDIYIHIIVFLTSDLNDLVKVPSGAMVYGPIMGVGGVNSKRRGKGDEK